jgi:hypothetical protein
VIGKIKDDIVDMQIPLNWMLPGTGEVTGVLSFLVLTSEVQGDLRGSQCHGCEGTIKAFLNLLLLPLICITMFTLGSNSRQRPPSPSDPHYRPQQYYIPNALSLPFQDSNPRQFTGEHTRSDLYPHPTEHPPHLYHNNIGGHGLAYDNKESNPTFNQSYNRCASSSSDLPHISYHNNQQPNSEGLDLAGLAHLKQVQTPTPNGIDHISLAPYHQSFPPVQHSAPIASASGYSGDSEFWPGCTPASSSPENSKLRKPRREKPRIELAPDQPPTTQGKPRARVYVACLQWSVLFISVKL